MRVSLTILMLMLTIKAFSGSSVTLEHTFNGYYFPYNFPVYLSSDDDRYFYCPMISAYDGNISLKTYNEDYSLRDNYNVHFSIPTNYKVFSLSFSSQFQLSDGTPFFVVVFNSTSLTYGDSNYAIAKMYDARTGNLISDLGTASLVIQMIGGVYIINGKMSICMLYSEMSQSNISSYKTKIFSLGKAASNAIMYTESNNGYQEPVYIYDMNGRLINQSLPGQPYIGIMPDGSSKVMIK